MRRRNKFILTGIVLASSAILIAWNTSAQSPTPALGVTEAKQGAASFENRTVSVRGLVEEESILMNGSIVESFVVMDLHEKLLVKYAQTPPDNFGPKDVVVTGILRREAQGTWIFEASSIQVGCSSKY